ncbi:MAG: AAA family ATPase [Candidatus Pacebacteria bacterium]|nr:AAA family ATPase [Candidatus Paceibacterota bacterium]
MNKLIFILGASGSGKTTNVKNIEAKYPDKYHFAYFDQPKVPSAGEVEEKHGGWEKWGIERTNEWVKKIKENYIESRVTLFDVHTKPENIENACKDFNITDYAVILLDCSDDERKKRLTDRGQPHLINDSLFEWAQFLRNEAFNKNYIIIDNTELTEVEGLKKVQEKVEELSIN